MNPPSQTINKDTVSVTEDVRSLVAATTSMAEEKISAARKRLAAALDSGAKILDEVEQQAAYGARCTDRAVRDHPYHAIGIAFVIGAVVAYLGNHR